jgi:acyl-coenzyme A thioesterase PaaI-like protein
MWSVRVLARRGVLQLRAAPTRPATSSSFHSTYQRDQRRHFSANVKEKTGQDQQGGFTLTQLALWGAFGLSFAAAGFFAALSTTLPANLLGLGFLSDAESLRAYEPDGDEARRIEEQIGMHPLVVSLRLDQGLRESRPHLKMPEPFRKQCLTAGVLHGSDKLVVPPYTWRDGEGKELVSVFFAGKKLCGHPGIVHGGLLATILDEGLAGCCFDAVPHKIAVTAKLEVNYRSPAMAGSYFVLRARTTRVEGRKAWVEGRIETLEFDDKKPPTVIADASALFVSPKNAAVCLVGIICVASWLTIQTCARLKVNAEAARRLIDGIHKGCGYIRAGVYLGI